MIPMRTLPLFLLLLPIWLCAQDWPLLRQIDGSGSEDILEICPLSDGNIAVAGIFNGGNPFDGNGSSAGKSDIFLACYDAQLELKWHIAGGNVETDEVTGLAQFPNGDIAYQGRIGSAYRWEIRFWNRAAVCARSLQPAFNRMGSSCGHSASAATA